MKYKKLFQKCWRTWHDLQWIMVIEECSELQKAITKLLRHRESGTQIVDLEHIADETADVEIMCAQIRVSNLKMNKMVNKYKREKIKRLKKLLGE